MTSMQCQRGNIVVQYADIVLRSVNPPRTLEQLGLAEQFCFSYLPLNPGYGAQGIRREGTRFADINISFDPHSSFPEHKYLEYSTPSGPQMLFHVIGNDEALVDDTTKRILSAHPRSPDLTWTEGHQKKLRGQLFDAMDGAEKTVEPHIRRFVDLEAMMRDPVNVPTADLGLNIMTIGLHSGYPSLPSVSQIKKISTSRGMIEGVPVELSILYSVGLVKPGGVVGIVLAQPFQEPLPIHKGQPKNFVGYLGPRGYLTFGGTTVSRSKKDPSQEESCNYLMFEVNQKPIEAILPGIEDHYPPLKYKMKQGEDFKVLMRAADRVRLRNI